ASLMLAGGSTLTQMGFAISFGIAVAAFVMAMFLTPSLTALIGRRAWWPGHDDRRAQPLAHAAASRGDGDGDGIGRTRGAGELAGGRRR
ncbi:MAG: MMPL family transporter, partial [Acidimicrobiales bacterium]